MIINKIKHFFAEKSLEVVHAIIKEKNLEASERVLLAKIFEENKPLTNAEQELSRSLYNKLITKEESSPFSWILNIFKGPRFKSLRIALGCFKSSEELAKIIVRQPTNNPKTTYEMVSGLRNILEKMSDGLSRRFNQLENAIINNYSNADVVFNKLNSDINTFVDAIDRIELHFQNTKIDDADKKLISEFYLYLNDMRGLFYRDLKDSWLNDVIEKCEPYNEDMRGEFENIRSRLTYTSQLPSIGASHIRI